MGFIWDAIAGCSAPGMTFLTAVLLFIAHLLSSVVGLILGLLNEFLALTILNTGGVTTARTVLLGGGGVGAVGGLYLSMAGLGLAIAAVAVVWGVVRHQESLMSGGRLESLRALAGRAAGAVLWIAAVPAALWGLILINDAVVNALVTQLQKAPFQYTFSCNPGAAIGHGIASLGTGLIATAITALFWEVIGLALIVGIIAAVGQYFLRLFQIVFWGALLPVAAGVSVADPQRRAWAYVWGQVQGSIFTQAAMALGLYITEAVIVGQHSANPLLSYMMGVAGFFVVSRIPRYFQEMQGHSVGGGSEMGAIAGGYVMGRFGNQALQATRGGILANQGLERAQQGNTLALTSGSGGLSGAFQRSRSRTLAMRGANEVALAHAENQSGFTEARQHAQGVRAVGQLDGMAANPVTGRDAPAAERELTVNPSIPLASDAPPGMGGVPTGTPTIRAPSGVAGGGGPSTDLAGSGAPPPDPPPDFSVNGPPSGFDSAGAPTQTGSSDPVGPRASADGVGVRSDAGGRTPFYGSGARSPVGLSAAEFAASVAPLARSVLRGDLVTSNRAQAAARGMTPDRYDHLMANPIDATPREAVRHFQVLERARTFRTWDQQLAANPQSAVAQLMQVSPKALEDPVQQQQILQTLYASVQQPASTVHQSFLKPVALDHQGDYTIS